MAQYVVLATSNLGIKAVDYPIKIAAIVITNLDSGASGVNFYVHSGSTLSGTTPNDGHNGIIYPMRAGTPAASAITRIGNLTFSGTSKQISRRFVAGATFDYLHPKSAGSDTFSPQTDLIIMPGTVFEADGLGDNFRASVYFEELHIS